MGNAMVVFENGNNRVIDALYAERFPERYRGKRGRCQNPWCEAELVFRFPSDTPGVRHARVHTALIPGSRHTDGCPYGCSELDHFDRSQYNTREFSVSYFDRLFLANGSNNQPRTHGGWSYGGKKGDNHEKKLTLKEAYYILKDSSPGVMIGNITVENALFDSRTVKKHIDDGTITRGNHFVELCFSGFHYFEGAQELFATVPQAPGAEPIVIRIHVASSHIYQKVLDKKGKINQGKTRLGVVYGRLEPDVPESFPTVVKIGKYLYKMEISAARSIDFFELC